METILSEVDVRVKKKYLHNLNDEVREVRSLFGYDYRNYWDKNKLIDAYCEYFEKYENKKIIISNSKNYSPELKKQFLEIVSKHKNEILESIKTYFSIKIGGKITDHVTKENKPKTFFNIFSW